MRSLRFAPLIVIAALAGCAENPADNVPKVTAQPPQAVASVDPTSTSAATATLTPAAATGSGLAFDGTSSKVDFIGSKVTGSHSGGFKTFSGTIELGSDATSVAKVSAEIDMNSLWADNNGLAGHLKNADFFDVAKFPKAAFVTTEIKPDGDKGATHTITGNLDLHGVKKSITFPATVAVTPEGATLKSEFALNRNDFGIIYPGKTDDLIRNEVVLKLDITAAKPKS